MSQPIPMFPWKQTTLSVHTPHTLNQAKVKFLRLMFEKIVSVSANTKQLEIRVWSAQRWVLQYEKDPDNIFKKINIGHPRVLNDGHKRAILGCVDEDRMDRLLQIYQGIGVLNKKHIINLWRVNATYDWKKAQFQAASHVLAAPANAIFKAAKTSLLIVDLSGWATNASSIVPNRWSMGCD